MSFISLVWTAIKLYVAWSIASVVVGVGIFLLAITAVIVTGLLK